jgi:hypothetical protein
MPDSLQALLQHASLSEPLLLAVPAALIGLPVLFYLFRNPLRRWRQERQIAWAIRRLGARALHDIRLPDGMGGEVVIDHLLLAADAILIIGVKRFEGMIFGSGHTDEWTQVINTRSYRFTNPDEYLQRQIGAVRVLVPKVAVKGLHLFTHHAVFPRHKPPNVLLLEDIRQQPRRPRLKEIPGELRSAWEALTTSLP